MQQLIRRFAALSALLVLSPVSSFASEDQVPHRADATALQSSQLCSTNADVGRVQVAVLRPYITHRVPPSPEQILEEGEHRFVERLSPVWATFKNGLCASQPQDNPKGFYARIVLRIDGGPLLVLSYPNPRASDEPVLVNWNGGFYRMDPLAVRFLLDYAVPGKL